MIHDIQAEATFPDRTKLCTVHSCRQVTKRDMLWNDYLPSIEANPDTYTVKADGRELRGEPTTVLPMAQRYFLLKPSGGGAG